MALADDRYSSYQSRPSEQEGPGPVGYLALVMAWAIPGSGHLIIGEKARGAIFAVTIHGLFALGMFFGGIRSISPPDQPIWTYTQFLAGWPMMVASKYLVPMSQVELKKLSTEYDNDIQQVPEQDRATWTRDFIEKHGVFAYHPKVHDIGAVYCGIAGMLNLLVIFDVLLRITGSPREVPVTRGGRPPQPPTVEKPA